MIIDAGVETYTRKTFSAERYEIWTMQSAYHSLPTIGGVMQAPGRMFAARDVAYHADNRAACINLDIAGAYPLEAGLEKWERAVELVRGQAVEVRDTWTLAKPATSITFSLITPCAVALDTPGVVALRTTELTQGRTSGAGQIAYDRSQLTVSSEEIAITDERLQSAWGTRLSRILFTFTNPGLQGTVNLRIV